METSYKTSNGRLIFKFDSETVKDAYRMLAELQKVFEYADACGVCGHEDIGFQVRMPQGYVYYELVCKDPKCGAVFTFGQTMEGGYLFPRVTDRDGNLLPNHGWRKWVAPSQQQQPQQQSLVSAPRGNADDRTKAVAGRVTDDDVPF